MPLRPLRSAVAIGKEATYGTVVAPTRFYPTADGGIDTKIVTGGRGYVSSASEGSTMESGVVPGARHVEGAPSIILDYEKIGMLMEFLFGKAEVVTPVTGSFSHVWDPDAGMTAVEGKGLSQEVSLGASARNRFSGIKITEGRFHVAAGEGMTFDATLLGQDGIHEAIAPTAYTFSTAPKIVANNLAGTLFTVSAIAFAIRDYDLRVKNGIAAFDPTITDAKISEPLRGDPFEVEWEATAEELTVGGSLVDELTGATTVPVIFDLQGPIASGVIRYELKFDAPKATIDEGGDPMVDSLGEPALLHLSGRCLKPISGTPPGEVRMTLVNNQATEI